MQDPVSRVVGLHGVEVRGVIEEGDQLDLEVELVARAGSCPRCGRASLDLKDRPVVRVRDLPIGGRHTYLRWRKRRYRCQGCRRTFTEGHPELPARQRVTRRFRARLRERVGDGAAHAEIARCERTTRYQVARAFQAGAAEALASRGEALPARRLSLDEAHHRRAHELATVVSDLDRRSVIEVLDGRSRLTVERYLRSLPRTRREAIEVVSIDPYEAFRQAIRGELPGARIVVDHFHLARGANAALGGQAAPQGRSPIGSGSEVATGHLPSPLPPHARPGALSECERRRLCELFQREPLIAEAWGLKEGSERSIELRTAPRPSAGWSAFWLRSSGHSYPRRGVRRRRPPLASRAARLLRRADHQRVRRGGDQQGEGDQAARLRPADVHRLQRPGSPSMRLTGSPGASPLDRREPKNRSPHPVASITVSSAGAPAGGEVSAGTPEGRGYASSGKGYSSHDARDHSTRPTTMDVPGRRGAP